MKNRIMIVEDNYYRFMTIKQLLECQLNVPVKIATADSDREVDQKTQQINPNWVITKPVGLIELLALLKKRNVNRRNCEITLLAAHESNFAKAA